MKKGSVLEHSLEELYENAPCAYLSTLADGTIIKVNRTFLSWLGYERDEVLYKKRWQELLSLPGRIYCETHLNPLLKMQGFAHEIALDMKRRDGSILPVLLNCVRGESPSGSAVINRMTLFNASERRRYEQELLAERRRAEQAMNSKARLLATLSHEIRNPLNAISCIAELLEMDAHSPEQEKYIAILKSSAQSLLELINDILDYSRLEADKIELDRRDFDLRELVQHLVYEWEPKAEAKGLALRLEWAAGEDAAYQGDPVKLKQVLTNLVSNAIKFTHEGEVRLRVAALDDADGERVEFRVADSGIGMQPAQLEKIFDEYAQASADISSSYGGSGLGLAIVSRLLQLFGSEIHVESAPGQGSTFRFELRLARCGRKD